jgi:hypothetical protein
MTTAVEYKKYNDLLDALAEFIKVNGDPAGLDAFLNGYAGHDWQRARGAANPHVTNHKEDDDGRFSYRYGGRWFTYDDLVGLLADNMPPGTVPDYDIDAEAERQAIKLIEDYFDRREWEIVGYERPIHF